MQSHEQAIPTVEKAKEKKLRNEDMVNDPSKPFHFEVLTQQSNVLTMLTLYELHGLSKDSREAV